MPKPIPNDRATQPPDAKDSFACPAEIRAAFAELEGAGPLHRLSGGLLHQSFHVRSDSVDYILQRISDIFSPGIHDNIRAVSSHLRARGLACFELLPTRTGHDTASDAQGRRWRLLTHLGGTSFDELTGTPSTGASEDADLSRKSALARARSAGALVARFHSALRDFDRPLAPLGFVYRDLPTYVAALERAVRDRTSHRLHAQTERLARLIAEAFATLGAAPAPPSVPERALHGDLKISNVLFREQSHEAFALIDFDTLMRGPLWMDLGDAWRSWCQVRSSPGDPPEFDLALFEASATGYFGAANLAIEASEIESLIEAPERLALEVCTRFATDSLEESYFEWDATSYPAAGEHHAQRAAQHWHYFETTRACRLERAAILGKLTRSDRGD